MVFLHSSARICAHQDPGSAVLDILQLLDVLDGNPEEKCTAVI